MSIRIPGSGPQTMFWERPTPVEEPESPDRSLAALELAHKADKAMRQFLERPDGGTGNRDGKNVLRPPDADFLRSVLADAPDDAVREEAGGHLAASMTSFALENAALRARRRDTLRGEALQRRQADAAGHISRLTEIIAGNSEPELRKTAAEAVLAQLQSLRVAQRVAGRAGAELSANTQRRTT